MGDRYCPLRAVWLGKFTLSPTGGSGRWAPGRTRSWDGKRVLRLSPLDGVHLLHVLIQLEWAAWLGSGFVISVWPGWNRGLRSRSQPHQLWPPSLCAGHKVT